MNYLILDSPACMYVIPTYNNPKGCTLPFDRRKKLVEFANKYNFYIIADEVYQLLAYKNIPPPGKPLNESERN